MDEHLSQRETEVLQYVASGNSNKEIAAHMSLTEEAVKTHMRNILASWAARTIARMP
jgi:two-component system NarL family response regulator